MKKDRKTTNKKERLKSGQGSAPPGRTSKHVRDGAGARLRGNHLQHLATASGRGCSCNYCGKIALYELHIISLWHSLFLRVFFFCAMIGVCHVFPLPLSGEGPPTATKTSAPARERAAWSFLIFFPGLGLGFVRHSLKFMDI